MSAQGSAAISAWKCTSFVLSHSTLSNCGLGTNWSSGNIGIAHGNHGAIGAKLWLKCRETWPCLAVILARLNLGGIVGSA